MSRGSSITMPLPGAAKRCLYGVANLLLAVGIGLPAALAAQTTAQQASRSLWRPPVSSDRSSHFESVNGRKVWFVDGLPFTALGAETEWDRILYPRYDAMVGVYDYTFPAAAAMHMNMLKVPVKWSQVEPEEGKYDFSYPDHVRLMAERFHLKIAFDWFGHYASGTGTLYSDRAGNMYAPAWVIEDAKRFPRAVDASGTVHPDAASYDSPAIVQVESAAFKAFLQHIRETDSADHTVIGMQVENEIAVFGGTSRKDPQLWRDHSAASNLSYKAGGFSDDLRFTASEYSTHWLRDVTSAGAQAYKLPFFMNFVGGQLEPGIVGGSPGEDVATYLRNIPDLTFIGLNNYVSDPKGYTTDDFRATLNRYKVGRNLPAITETNSGTSQVAERSLFLAIGEFGSPLFTPWSLIISYPEKDKPYVLEDGQLANGAFRLSEAYEVVNRALPAVSYFGGTDKAAVFLADVPGTPFSKDRALDGVDVHAEGSEDGQLITLQPSSHELILIGYRCSVILQPKDTGWRSSTQLHLEAGQWLGSRWVADGTPVYVADAGRRAGVRIYLPEPQVVRVSW